ncbi:uncharacterized protein LOC143179491 [Calliopsis andreniformis]|uniref:uncharacterized protein LOC143179491 n=1 Tax=Calliopsis andreniformis TaxID=337506 RepID=UPI003FCD983D
MPGIYVRKAKWIDWMQQRENPVLTVPGSYWLCHKNNIYKFIFRYHRTTRGIQEFGFGRELMKVIRRIIKNQPRQGQQFGTSHLLVTYNHTSWTRQDKMFAMLKFKERSVAAFSHAFVLTIKILHSLESTGQSVKYVTQFSFPDESTVLSDEDSSHVRAYEKKNEKENKRLRHSPKSDFLEKKNQCNIQNETLDSTNRNVQLDNHLTNEQSVKEESEYGEISDVTNSSKTEETVTKETPPETNTRFNKKAKVKLKKEKDDVINNESNKLNSLEESSIENYLTRRAINTDDIKLSNNSNNLFKIDITERDFTDYEPTSSTNNLQTDNGTDNNIDSINLPYQYLMEKEVENAKQKILYSNEIKNNITSYNRDEQCSKRHKSENINEANSEELFTNAVKSKDSPSPKRRKHSSDNITSRSSDITDLVMEGLMFTIRQGQDTVAVIEQKTKLEVDEVLENSEKIETTKGEKCLRNSSLLGLENLITMIELPKPTEVNNTNQKTIVQENILKSQSTNNLLLPSNETEHYNTRSYLKYMQWQPNFTSAAGASFSSSSEIYDDHEYNKNMTLMENENPEYEEEEEDIIPEALQDEIFQSSMPFQKRNKSNNNFEILGNKDLLMDDIDAEDVIKSGTIKTKLNKKGVNESSHNIFTILDEKSVMNRTYEHDKHCRSNVPIIISNEIITVDQIPLPLQKILNNTLSVKNAVISKTDKINTNINESSEKQLHQEKDVTLNEQLNSNTLKNTQYVENETDNECTSSTMPTAKVKNVSTIENNVNLKEKEPQNQNGKGKQLLPKEIQDITHKFYQELTCLQKKKDVADQKCLRSKRSLKVKNNNEMQIEMVKFFHDITRGAKVVVRRMSTKSIHSILGKSSSLAACMQR